MACTLKMKLWRGDRSGGELKDYDVEVESGEVVLDAIHRVQATQAGDLAVRWNCKAGKCGSCSAEINGRPKLMCMCRLSDYDEAETITVTPMRTFPVIRDLVTDVSYNYEKAKELPYAELPPRDADGKRRMMQEDVERGQEFRKCIECFLCQNTCHVVRDHDDNKKNFAGPRFFLRYAELDMHPLDTLDRREATKEQAGLGYCNITKCCTEVCPEGIHITDNAIIPMKERIVDKSYDPLVWLGNKIGIRNKDRDSRTEGGPWSVVAVLPAPDRRPAAVTRSSHGSPARRKPHTWWLPPRRRSYADTMTDVEGGLDAPDELQPEPGALALASIDDDWTRADWEKAAAAALRKSHRLRDEDPDDAVWATLTRTTYDDIAIPPLGTADLLDDLSTHGRPTRSGGWDVRTRTSGDNAAALADLENGATSLWLVADEGPPAGLAGALAGVRLDLAPRVLEGPPLAHAEGLTALGALHPDSNLGATEDADLVAFARLGLASGVRALVVDGTSVHEQGASDGQELGWVLARGAEMLRALEAAGITAARGLGLVELRLAATDEQFSTIAKFRALRRLWSRLAELCDVADPQTRIGAVTSRPMTSAYDVHVNLLRGTIAAFGAGVGGADSVHVVPFDEPTGEISVLGRRMARNTSALLVAESHVAAVADPAGGAYAVERLTDDLARVAWTELERIETDGPEAFASRVAEVRARRT